MPEIKFLQLHDSEFLAETIHVPAAKLARRLGCQPLTVEKYRQLHGVLQRPRWHAIEIEILTHFYGRFPVAYICEGLRRGKQAVYTYAYRHGLKASRALRTSDQALAAFWAAWQEYISHNWTRWRREGVAEEAFELLWRPASRFVSCRKCPRGSECRVDADTPLDCERLTVREYLRYFT